MKIFGCKHVFSEVKDGYQYCKFCGIAIAAPIIPCDHIYKTLEAKVKRMSNVYNNYLTHEKLVYVLQCTKCGNIKTYVVE